MYFNHSKNAGSDHHARTARIPIDNSRDSAVSLTRLNSHAMLASNFVHERQ